MAPRITDEAESTIRDGRNPASSGQLWDFLHSVIHQQLISIVVRYVHAPRSSNGHIISLPKDPEQKEEAKQGD